MAKVAGRDYPTILTRRTTLDKLYRELVKDPCREQFARTLAGFQAVRQNWIMSRKRCQRLATTILASHSTEALYNVRVFAAVNEAYNFCIASRYEWLNPFDQWRNFVVWPYDRQEHGFALLCVGIGDIRPDEVEKVAGQIPNDSTVQILTTIRALAVGFQREYRELRDILEHAGVEEMRRRLIVPTSVKHIEVETEQRAFLSAAKAYIVTDEPAWHRGWFRYSFDSWVKIRVEESKANKPEEEPQR